MRSLLRLAHRYAARKGAAGDGQWWVVALLLVLLRVILRITARRGPQK